MLVESNQLAKTSKDLNVTIVDKKNDIRKTEEIIANVDYLMSRLDQELEARLITEDQAQQARIALQTARNAATDARTQAIQLQQTVTQLQQGSSTLQGGALSLSAISSVQQKAQLQSVLTQLKIQLMIATSTSIALTSSIAESERVLATAKTSPYYQALNKTVTVLFVPYDNIYNIKIGEPIYDCHLQILACHKVGKVKQIYEAEQYAKHPLFKTDLRGRFIGVEIDPQAAKSPVVFIGGKPLLL